MINTIVVGTDGSSHGQNAVTWTAELARQLGARVVLVHVAPPLGPPIVGAGGYVMYVPQDVVDQTSADLQERVITEFCEPLRAAGVEWGSRVQGGQPPSCSRMWPWRWGPSRLSLAPEASMHSANCSTAAPVTG
jgi:nucleotide-binding universal stress UspA family protein